MVPLRKSHVFGHGKLGKGPGEAIGEKVYEPWYYRFICCESIKGHHYNIDVVSENVVMFFVLLPSFFVF